MSLLLLCVHSRPAFAAPRVAVVESDTAAAWLRSVGLDCRELTTAELVTAPPDAPLLIVPLDRIRAEAPLRALTEFASRGGKVIAVYWGTIARPEQQSQYPVYGAAPALGITVRGWTLAGPGLLQTPASTSTEDSAVASSLAASPIVGSELRLGQLMMVQVGPSPTTQVLARLTPTSGGATLPLVLRNGNMIYVAANLFQRGTPADDRRGLFFWVMEQSMPGFVSSGARERAGAAVAAVIQARERLAASPDAAAASARPLLEEAAAAAAQAKTLAAGSQLAASIAASEHARELTERALGVLEKR